jgi:hypothetical protein
LAQPGEPATCWVSVTGPKVDDLDEQVVAMLLEADLDSRVRGMLDR